MLPNHKQFKNVIFFKAVIKTYNLVISEIVHPKENLMVLTDQGFKGHLLDK